MASLSVRNLVRRFGAVTALDDVSLDVAEGAFVTLLGASGCGKSTLLRIVAGLDAQDGGQVLLDGAPIDGLRPRARDVAMVFQSYALYPYMTVAQNVSLPLTMRRLSRLQRLPLLGRLMPGSSAARAAIARDVHEVARALALEPLLARKPAQLSGGQRQRVALARAMVRQPKLFLMDEPLSNLDARLRVQARDEIAALHRRLGTTFLYVTHDQDEAMTMSDQVAVMDAGRILQLAPPQVLYDEPATLAVARFIGNPGINLLPVEADEAGLLRVGGQATGLAAYATGPVTLALRPEVLKIAPRGLPARITHVDRLGPVAHVHATIAGTDGAVTLVVDPHLVDPRPGQRVQLAADPARALLFDAAGARIRAAIHASEVLHA